MFAFYVLITPVLALLDVLSVLIACLFVNWWAPLFATDKAKLPNWLAWFDTFDDDLDTGIRFGLVESTGYWGRVGWLYRNPSYGFGYWALGCAFSAADWKVSTYRDDGDLTFIAVSSNGHFNFHVTRFGVRLKLGWKAWNMFDPVSQKWRTAPWGPEWRIPFVFSISKA